MTVSELMEILKNCEKPDDTVVFVIDGQKKWVETNAVVLAVKKQKKTQEVN